MPFHFSACNSIRTDMLVINSDLGISFRMRLQAKYFELNDILNWIQYLKAGEQEKLKMQEKCRLYKNLRAVSYPKPMTVPQSRPVHFKLEFCTPENLHAISVWCPSAKVMAAFSIVQSFKSLLKILTTSGDKNRCLGSVSEDNHSYWHPSSHFSSSFHTIPATTSCKTEHLNPVSQMSNHDTKRTVIKILWKNSNSFYHHSAILQMFTSYIYSSFPGKYNSATQFHITHFTEITR